MNDGMSVMAATPFGQIIGVCLNGIIRRREELDAEKEDENSNPKFCKIIRFLKHIEKESDIFGKYPEMSKILCVKILSVDGAWRGRGIAKELMHKTRELASQESFGLVRADCTSYYSAKALAKLGFECIYTLQYSDYREDDEIVFKPDPPHNEIKIYVQEI
ncbi:Acetyltransferase [Oryctes borbonicus]|uniref:aralkylamine N-acetyltransferase n=1 Tax=Oryctes borbonicus TaxID=1629725 RepID=A0A0T6AUT0_9SCAR|nr:Acetyltransferase [Oryctes borbonicus]